MKVAVRVGVGVRVGPGVCVGPVGVGLGVMVGLGVRVGVLLGAPLSSSPCTRVDSAATCVARLSTRTTSIPSRMKATATAATTAMMKRGRETKVKNRFMGEVVNGVLGRDKPKCCASTSSTQARQRRRFNRDDDQVGGDPAGAGDGVGTLQILPRCN